MSRETVRACLCGLLVVSVVARMFLGWRYFGFFTGDDVEILEAGFRSLGLHYQAWPLRNTLVSDLVVGPVLRLAALCGASDHRLLVWVASWPFAVLSTLNIYLLYRLTRFWSGSERVAVGAAVCYAWHWLPLGLGSMAYPRTVAVTCVLSAALLASGREQRAWREIGAGGAIALAFAMRYSEAIYLPPLLMLAVQGPLSPRQRIAALGRVAGGFVVGGAVVAGIYEALTWGSPFAALIQFARYTLIDQRASSLTPVQPLLWYFWRLPHWWCPAALPFIWLAVRRRTILPAWFFVAVPILLLSAIHHKELRYLQGVIPFACALSAAGAVNLWELGWRRTTLALASVVLLWQLAGLRFVERKTMPSVLAAEALAAEPSVRSVAVVQLWGFGDRLYFGDARTLIDLPFPTASADVERLASGVDAVALYSEDFAQRAELAGTLSRMGFCTWRRFPSASAKGVVVLRPCAGGRRPQSAEQARRLPETSRSVVSVE